MRLLAPFNAFPHLRSIVQARRGWMIGIAVVGIFASLLEGVGIGLVIPLVSTFMPSAAPNSGGLADILLSIGAARSTLERAMLLLGLIFLAILLKNLAYLLCHWLMARVDGDVGHEIRTQLAERALTIGYPFYLTETPTRIVHIIATESWRASGGVRAVLVGISAAASVIVTLCLLIALDWRLFLGLAAGLLAIWLVEQRLLRATRQMSERVTRVNDRLADRMMVSVLAMRPIRVFGQEAYEKDRFSQASAAVRDAIFDVDWQRGKVPALLDLLHTAVLIAIILIAVSAGVGTTIPVLVAFLVLLQRAQPHLRSIEQVRSQVAAAHGAFAEIEWLLDPSGKPAQPSGTKPFEALRHDIRFERVAFHYPAREDDVPALKAVSLTIQAGKSTALVGASGSGKSTIVNLLCRLIDPSDGHILIDDTDLRDIDPAAWRSRLGLAGQDIELVDGTMAENIAYGLPGASAEEIARVAEIADLGPLKAMLSAGLETGVGSRGLQLSGGQRQKIGLARALIRKPDLLILDEATSAMDAEAEARVLANIARLDCTVLMISHRASALIGCDHIVQIASGMVVEQDKAKAGN